MLVSVSLVALVSGLHIKASSEITFEELNREEYLVGNIDLINQGNISAIKKTINSQLFFNLRIHTVQNLEDIGQIAAQYGVSQDTIKWANPDKVNQYNGNLIVGSQLYIPDIDGVVYSVQKGDTIDSIVSKTSGDKFQIIEINQLAYSNFSLIEGQKLLVPGGKLPPPPPLIPTQNLLRRPANVGVNILNDEQKALLNSIQFSNPLSNPDCAGYSFSRGYFTGHNGVDLGKAGGCSVRAVADGVVGYAGWGNYGEGFFVRIDHGNSISSVYFHAETLWVSTGQTVVSGQEIMYMGCTGNCTGTHLHFGIRYEGIYIDPSPYVPY
jgi:hypothetical protein